MAFAFKRRESVRASLRRLSRACLERALKNCGEDQLESVHSVRKEIKKLRALARLIRAEVGKANYQKLNAGLRDAARYLAGVRDAEVKVRALERLSHGRPGKKAGSRFPELRRSLRMECRAKLAVYQRRDHGTGVKKCLKKQAAKFRKLELPERRWKIISGGVVRSYRSGRAELRLLRSHPSPEQFHCWRKRVKDLWYALQLLEPIWPEQMVALACEFERLGELLGDDHDLHMLASAVSKKSRRLHLRQEAGELLPLIAARQNILRADALQLGAKLYKDKPSVFCERLHRYWKRWKSIR